MGGLGVQVSALFGRSALTATITAVVKKKHAEPGHQDGIGQFEPVTDVAAVAMAHQDDQMAAGGSRRSWEEPAVQVDAVVGTELNVLERTL